MSVCQMFSLGRSSNWHFIFCVESIDVVQPCSCKWCWIWIVMRQKAELRSLVYGPMSFSSLKAELNLTKFYMLSGCFAAGKGFLNMFGFNSVYPNVGNVPKLNKIIKYNFVTLCFRTYNTIWFCLILWRKLKDVNMFFDRHWTFDEMFIDAE